MIYYQKHKLIIALLAILISLSFSLTNANEPLAIEAMPFEIMIEFEDGYDGKDFYGEGIFPGRHAYVDVTLNYISEVMLGYDFLIAYDNSMVTLYGAFPNQEVYAIPGQYEWEYFTYHFVDNCGNDCPSGLIQIISIADQNDGIHHPVIDPSTGRVKVLPKNTVLFTIDFLVANDYLLECSFVPLSFFWRDCTDNSIAMISANDNSNSVTQAISKDVFGYNGTYFSITDLNATFPTYYGAPDECNQKNALNQPLRFIDFKDGGIKIVCSDWNCRGDVNLDGICGNISDVITFANYFIYGLDAFTINEEGQKAATDVNSDGIPLSINDFVYMTRLYTRDVITPYIYTIDSSGILAVSEYSDSIVVESSFDISLGAMLFTFEKVSDQYNISFDYSIAHMRYKTNLSGDTLKVLIFDIEKDKNIPAGNNRLLSLSNAGEDTKLISTKSAGYYGERLVIKTSNIQVPDQMFLSQNYPNPFNSSTIIEFDLLSAGQWTIEIFNVTGQTVKTINGLNSSGPVQISWDGADEDGQMVSSGVYFYRLKSGDQSITKKMMLLK